MPRKDYFPKVREAREALRARALEIIENQMRIISEALAEKDFETAAKANQFLMAHLPADDDGTKVIDPTVDAPGRSGREAIGPSIQIGFQLGGMTAPPKELPKVTEQPVIDIKPELEPHE